MYRDKKLNDIPYLSLVVILVKQHRLALVQRMRGSNSMDKDNFFANVYDVVREIPSGRVTTYGAIAHYLGLTRSARMVGWAMNAAHALPDVPAHRVVNRNGILTGKHHFSPSDPMQLSLEKEGVHVVDDQVQNFDRVFWDPSRELHAT